MFELFNSNLQFNDQSTIQTYDGTESWDSTIVVVAIVVVAASPQSCNHDLATWQMGCNYNGQSVLQSRDCYLQPSLPCF